MEPDDNLFYLVFLLVLILIGAFFTMSEVAIISLNDSKIRKMAQEGNRKAQLLVGMINEPSRFLATIQVGVTVSGFLAAAVTAHVFTGRIVSLLREAPVSPSLLRAVALVVVTLLLSFIVLVFSELVPKRIGMQHYEAIAMAVARPLSLIAALEKPFVFLLSTSTNGILRLLGINPHRMPEQVTEEEIRMMIDVGNETGNIEENEKDMINNIFEFDDRTAQETMIHRTEIVALEAGAPLRQIIDTALESGYSRIPVYQDDLDSIVGILYVKDLLELVLQSPDDSFQLADHMREPMYVLESTSCKMLLEEFQKKKIQMAIVVDEYGGTSGLVTMEDLLESIVGNIQDEYDDEEEDISPIGENSYRIDALADLEEVEKLFGLEFDEEITDEFETIGGYIIHRLGYIPSEGEHPSVMLGDVCFTILQMDERRIDKLRAEVTKPPVQQKEPSTAETGTAKEKF